MSTLYDNIARIENSISRMKAKLDLPENTPLEEVTQTIENSSGADITNGVVDGGYYAMSGTIEPNTFINTNIVTGLTSLSFTGTYHDSAMLDDEHTVLVSHSSSKCYLYVFKGTSQVASVNFSTYTSATYSVCTAEDGVNIFVLVGNVGYECAMYHFTFSNNTLTQVVKQLTESKGSYNYMSQKGISYFKKVGTTHYCLVCVQYDDWPYVGIVTSNGSSGSKGSLVGLHDNNNYTITFGGFAKVSDTSAIVCTNRKTNSSGTNGVGAYFLSISGTTITKSSLSGTVSVNPHVFKVNDKVILIANQDTSNYNVTVDIYNISGSSVTYGGNKTISNFGSGSTFVTRMGKINDNNFLIVHTYYNGSSTLLKYIPCIANGSTITYGTAEILSQTGTNLKKVTKTSTNKLNIFLNGSIITGTLKDLTFSVGGKFVTPATGTIKGITKTMCSTDVAGEIWKL